MPSTQRPDQEPEVEQSPTPLEDESNDAQGQSSSLEQQTRTVTTGEIDLDDVDMRHADAKDFEPDAAYGTYGGIADMYAAEAIVPMEADLPDETPPSVIAAASEPPANMGELIRRDAETRDAWTHDEVSGNIQGFGQVVRGVHGDTSESSGDTDLPDLDAQTDVHDNVTLPPLPTDPQPPPPA
jgi:hypothetical protein